MERSVLRSAVGGVREAELTGGISRSRPGLSATTGFLSHLLDFFDVQYLRFSFCQHARLRRHDLRRSYGALSEIESGLLGRKLFLGALAPLAHGRIRRDNGSSGIPVSKADA